MRNQILKKVTVSIMLSLCINASVADTSTSVSCAEGGSASAYSRSENGASYASVNCSSNNEQNAIAPAGIVVSKSYLPCNAAHGGCVQRFLSTTAVYILFGRREPSALVVSLSGSVLMFSTPHGPVQHMFDSLAGVPQQMR